MKISLVIPAFNEEAYLPATLASVMQLDRKPDETIVIDSCSTDATARIAQSFGARVIRIKQRGIGYARQTGLEKAKFEIVAYTDADTIVGKNWLSNSMNYLKQPDVCAVYGPYKVEHTWIPYSVYMNRIQPIAFKIMHAIGMPIAAGQNMAFKKTAGFKAGGFPADFQSCEDIEMIRRLRSVGRIVYLPENEVRSSGRRGYEKMRWAYRVTRGMIRYYVTRKADTFSFPDIR